MWIWIGAKKRRKKRKITELDPIRIERKEIQRVRMNPNPNRVKEGGIGFSCMPNPETAVPSGKINSET